MEILKSFECNVENEKKQMLNDLAFLSNQLLCFKTDKHLYCDSEKGDDGVWHHPMKCTFYDFVEEFEKLHDDMTQHYLRKERNEFREKFSETIDLQNNVLIWKPKLEQLLRNEYQCKNSDQGKYYGINNVYGTWYLEHLDTMTHLEVFDIFDKSNNFEIFTYA